MKTLRPCFVVAQAFAGEVLPNPLGIPAPALEPTPFFAPEAAPISIALIDLDGDEVDEVPVVGAVRAMHHEAPLPAGLHLGVLIGKLPNKYRTVVLNGTGDRRDDDIREFDKIAADNFDRIVIRTGNNLRGRDPEDLHKLLQDGIAQSKKDPAVRIIPDGRAAIHHAIKYGRKGELVVTLADLVPKDIAYVQEYREMVNEKK